MLLIGLGLSADCFAVALGGGVSMRTVSYPQVFRTAFSFGFFQFLMPLLGWLAGRSVVGFISNFDHWVAFGLLAAVGGKMLWEAFRDNEDEPADISRGMALVGLSVATSIDALAVGLSLALLDVHIVVAGSAFGAVTFIMTVLGFFLSRRLGPWLGKRARIVGGVILVAIGLRILLSAL